MWTRARDWANARTDALSAMVRSTDRQAPLFEYVTLDDLVALARHDRIQRWASWCVFVVQMRLINVSFGLIYIRFCVYCELYVDCAVIAC